MKIIPTKDKSFTLFSEIYQEHYHSIHGAINESEHIYINAGLKSLNLDKINIFEMGLGTGLNAYLTSIYAEKFNKTISYTAIEKHPLEAGAFLQSVPLNFRNALFNQIHFSQWNSKVQISSQMELLKIIDDIQGYEHRSKYHLVYYDAFSPETQPELWTEDIFRHIYKAMFSGGVLVSYCVKGTVKRALKAVGFVVEKLPGPQGKREIIRAIK